MRELHTGISLFLVLASALSITAADLCARDWKYHDPTGTCMKFIKEWKNYHEAGQRCEGLISHLVYIFNQETDTFVKDIIKKEGVEKAWIGLHDAVGTGQYQWVITKQNLGNYKGWADANHTPDEGNYNSAVIITKDGWKEYTRTWSNYFVCQADAVFPQPEITCPAAEVGKQSPNIDCVVDIPSLFSLTTMTFERAGVAVRSCDNSLHCRYETVYGPAGAGSQTSSLKINSVERIDETNWTCSVIFNQSRRTTSQPCNLKMYTVPNNIDCQHKFIETKVEITCTTGWIYPQATCSWPNYRDFYNLETIYGVVTSQKTENDANGMIYYNTACTVSFNRATVGVYHFKVSIRPDLQGLERTISPATQDITVTVALPEDPPVLYNTKLEELTSSLVVPENTFLSITCKITGGNPSVYRAYIKCHNVHYTFKPVEVSFSMKVNITQDFHNSTCECWGNHVAGNTKVASVKLLVKSPAKVTTFKINNMEDKAELLKPDNITIQCTSTGYPVPKMVLYNKSGQILNQVKDNTITHRMAVTCRDAGKYLCSAKNAENNDKDTNEKYIHLRVQCSAEHCSYGATFSKVGVAVGTNATFQICVLVYPSPTSVRLYKGNGTDKPMDTSRYEASFNYTDETAATMKIQITILSLTQQDLGWYLLYTEYRKPHHDNDPIYSYLKFELQPQGPPFCPTNFTVLNTFHDLVTLSWKPGFDGGLIQTFIVFIYNGIGSMSSLHTDRITSPTKHVDGFLNHNITGLSERTTYTFGIRVENSNGTTECSHLQANASITASSAGSSGQNLMATVVPIIVGLLLVILVAVAVLLILIRRRRSKTEKPGVCIAETAQTSLTNQTIASNRTDGDVNLYVNVESKGSTAAAPIAQTNNKKLFKRAKEELAEDCTYTQVNKQTNKQATPITPIKKKKLFERTKEEQAEDCTYTQVNKKAKKPSKVAPTKDKKPLENTNEKLEQECTYSQVNKNPNRKEYKGPRNIKLPVTKEKEENKTYIHFLRNDAKKKGQKSKNEQIYNNEIAEDSNVNKSGASKADAAKDEENVYANAPSAKKEGREVGRKTIDDGRTVNEDGLIYALVEINKKTTNPEIVAGAEPKAPAKNKVAMLPVKSKEDNVEYLSLDFVATDRHM